MTKPAHKVVIDASGRDSRGNGTANATVTGTMVADGPDKTTVTMVTDMTITGRPAQFGRGVISDVADKIIGQFAACVADKLAPQAGADADAEVDTESPTEALPAVTPATVAAPAPSATAAPEAEASPNGTVGAAVRPAPVSQAPMRSEIDAIDLLDTAGAPVLKRLAPVLGGALLLLIIIMIRRSRRS